MRFLADDRLYATPRHRLQFLRDLGSASSAKVPSDRQPYHLYWYGDFSFEQAFAVKSFLSTQDLDASERLDGDLDSSRTSSRGWDGKYGEGRRSAPIANSSWAAFAFHLHNQWERLSTTVRTYGRFDREFDALMGSRVP